MIADTGARQPFGAFLKLVAGSLGIEIQYQSQRDHEGKAADPQRHIARVTGNHLFIPADHQQEGDTDHRQEGDDGQDWPVRDHRLHPPETKIVPGHQHNHADQHGKGIVEDEARLQP